MNLLIDATNINSGGGLTHLKELLNNNQIKKSSIIIYVLASKKTLNLLKLNNINKINFLFNHFPKIISIPCKIIILNFLIYFLRVDILFVPGGWYIGFFKNVITLCQNYILFNDEIIEKYYFSLRYIKFNILKSLQKNTFKNALGIIYLNEYIKQQVSIKIKRINHKFDVVIPHGISNFFFQTQKKIKKYDIKNINKFKIVYVSSIDKYKNQLSVIKTVNRLYKNKFNIHLTIIGSPYKPYYKKIKKLLKNIKIHDEFLTIIYNKNPKDLSELYKEVDLAIFASSCENLPITLLEYMASRLPILSNNIEPMKSILKEGAKYFDVKDLDNFYFALKNIILNIDDRSIGASILYKESLKYNWKECSSLTFNYFTNMLNNLKNHGYK